MTVPEAKELLTLMWVKFPSRDQEEVTNAYEALNMAIDALDKEANE